MQALFLLAFLAAAPSSSPGRAAALPDVRLVDQDGRPVRFHSDVVRGRTVVIGAAYTRCNGVCPPQGARFAALQRALGRRLGRDVRLVTISLDPERDDPAALKAWGARYGARRGWRLLTGRKEEVDRLLRALTGEPAGTAYHTPAIYVVGDRHGLRERVYGLGALDDLLATIDRVGRGQRAVHAHGAAEESSRPGSAPPPRRPL